MGEEGCDEEVASSKRKTKLKTRVQNRHPIYDQNGGKMAKIDTQFLTKTAEKTLWGRTYLDSPYKGVPPRGKSKWCGNLIRMIIIIVETEGHLSDKSDHISIVSLKIIYVDKTKLKYTTHGELLMYAFRQMTNASRLWRQQTPTPSFNH